MSSDAWLWYARRAMTTAVAGESEAEFAPATPAPSSEKASEPPKGMDTKPVYLAMFWLRKLLESGPIDVKTVEALAVKEGFSQRTLRRARDRLNLKPVRRDRKRFLEADSLQSEERIEAKRLAKEAKVAEMKRFRAMIKREKEFRRAAKLFNIPIK
jgi:hypothetical protein